MTPLSDLCTITRRWSRPHSVERGILWTSEAIAGAFETALCWRIESAKWRRRQQGQHERLVAQRPGQRDGFAGCIISSHRSTYFLFVPTHSLIVHIYSLFPHFPTNLCLATPQRRQRNVRRTSDTGCFTRSLCGLRACISRCARPFYCGARP